MRDSICEFITVSDVRPRPGLHSDRRPRRFQLSDVALFSRSDAPRRRVSPRQPAAVTTGIVRQVALFARALDRRHAPSLQAGCYRDANGLLIAFGYSHLQSYWGSEMFERGNRKIMRRLVMFGAAGTLVLVMNLVTSARLGDLQQVLTRSSTVLERGFTAIVSLGICLEATAAALAPVSSEAAAVLHGQVDVLMPGLALAEPHITLRERGRAAIDAHLDTQRVSELRARGAAMTQADAAAYALDAIARALTGAAHER